MASPLDERRRGATCWAAAFVVLSRRSYSGAGPFKMVKVAGRGWAGKGRFCRDQRRRTHEWMNGHPGQGLRPHRSRPAAPRGRVREG